jgi:hypothetical protein
MRPQSRSSRYSRTRDASKFQVIIIIAIIYGSIGRIV